MEDRSNNSELIGKWQYFTYNGESHVIRFINNEYWHEYYLKGDSVFKYGSEGKYEFHENILYLKDIDIKVNSYILKHDTLYTVDHRRAYIRVKN